MTYGGGWCSVKVGSVSSSIGSAGQVDDRCGMSCPWKSAVALRGDRVQRPVGSANCRDVGLARPWATPACGAFIRTRFVPFWQHLPLIGMRLPRRVRSSWLRRQRIGRQFLFRACCTTVRVIGIFGSCWSAPIGRDAFCRTDPAHHFFACDSARVDTGEGSTMFYLTFLRSCMPKNFLWFGLLWCLVNPSLMAGGRDGKKTSCKGELASPVPAGPNSKVKLGNWLPAW
jgi:hypothetical protein